MDSFILGWNCRILVKTYMVYFIIKLIRLFEKYSELDLRYPLREPTIMAVSAVEFFIMGPLCVWIALRIKN